MRFLWATRGRVWGFRFLNTGELRSPLAQYQEVFAGREFTTELFERLGTVTALRFEDPLGRVDRSGRVIPHDFVVIEGLAKEVDSLEAARDALWPLVESEYASIYDLTTLPISR